MNSAVNPLLDAALAYAEQGWPVLPLHNPENGACSCGRNDCDSPAKHPRTDHGLKDASSDPQTLRRWWRRWPAANVGLLTGTVADVLDLDSADVVEAFRGRFKESDLDPLSLPRVGTGKGVHVYFAPTGAGNRTAVVPGVDWRGRDGYAIAPPSRHITGAQYTWRHALDGAPPDAPPWLVELVVERPRPADARTSARISSSAYARRALDAEVTRVLQAAEGTRNDTLNRAAFSLFQLVAGGELDDGEVTDALTRAGIASGLSTSEVERTIASGRRDGLQEPRTRPITDGVQAGLRTSPHPVSGDNGQGAALPRAPWPPPLQAAAYHGLAGDVVDAIDPHTEADPVAVLIGFLAAFGNVVGSGPHAVVGSTHHPARLFAALVGETARARKGDSWAADRKLMAAVAPEWADTRVQGGLSSGEGLIAAVRDSLEQMDRKTGEISVIDSGVSDKRLLVVEPELARTLRVMHRDGNTLSTIMRDAWDTGALRVMTKVQLRASGAHVSVLGHITVEELRRELDETSIANGFANRILWFAVRRSKLVPEPVPFDGPKVDLLAQRIRSAVEFAHGVNQVERDDDARRMWRDVYEKLTADHPGMLGAILNRSEAQAVRLSLAYALLDRSPIVRPAHLQAALAVVDYVEASAAFIFADRLGDPVADGIVQLLTATPGYAMSRASLYDSFGRHMRRERMGAAIATLVASGRAAVTSIQTGGRPIEMVTLTNAAG